MKTPYVARPAQAQPGRPLLGALALVAALLLTTPLLAPVAAADTSTISGVVFEDVDRDGVADDDEPRWAEKGIWVFTADGSTFVDSATTDADGSYTVTGLAAGDYLVKYHPTSWDEIKYDWVPTTTDGVWPERVVTVDGTASFDLGWRPITTSSDWDAPISTHDASSGLQIESFTDAVTAEEVHATLTSGSLLGDERPHTTVKFGYPEANSSCTHSISGSPGSYSNFSASCHVDYEDWLASRHNDLFHEYGHAWSRYYQKIVNQWEDLDPYLEARGIDPDDDRLGSSHKWLPGEIIAEDFRLLFGSPNAQSWPQENDEIPHATEVDGLATWLSTTFMDGTTDDDSTTTDEAPTAAFAEPDDGATVSGDLTVGVDATDEEDTTVTVEVAVDGGTWQSAAHASGDRYELVLDTTTLTEGSHQLDARATDSAGQTTQADPVSVTVDQPDDTDEATVTDLSGANANNGPTWTAIATPLVEEDGQPVADTDVVFDWDATGHKTAGSGTVSCTTDSQGLCSVTVEVKKNRDAVAFTVTSLPALTGEESLTVSKP